MVSDLGKNSRIQPLDCILYCLCMMDTSNSSLAQHLLTSWQPTPLPIYLFT